MYNVCIACNASLACVAGEAEWVFTCRYCRKVSVKMYNQLTILIGREKPAECSLPLKEARPEESEWWRLACMPCRKEQIQKIQVRLGVYSR